MWATVLWIAVVIARKSGSYSGFVEFWFAPVAAPLRDYASFFLPVLNISSMRSVTT